MDLHGCLSKESQVWTYLRHLKESGAAVSRATSLLEAVRFSHFTMRVDDALEVMESLRIRGLASQLYISKRPWQPSDVLTVAEVEFLHECFVDPKRSDIDRVIVGHMLHDLYARARHSDLLSVTNAFLDEDGAFFEVGATIHKGARNMDTKAKLLPVVLRRLESEEATGQESTSSSESVLGWRCLWIAHCQ